ncbi:MAG TPA: Rne/Rng family ribonuclease, partial [Thermoleophilaceae bacterium]
MDGNHVAELYIERRGSRSIVGNIYKGKVDNVLPGLEAAFVDIGLDKNGFLHADDIVMPGVEVARRGRGGKGQRITELLKPGQEIVVQVMKDPLKTKGARLTMQLSIAGRYLVYVPQGEGVGVSRRLEDKERDRLRKETAKLDLGGGGAIIRTAARGAKRVDFEREIKYLHKLYEVLQKRAKDTAAPAMVFQEADLSVRVVRDIFSAHFEDALVDDQKAFERLVSFLTRTAPELVERVELYKDADKPLFEHFGIDEVMKSTLSRRVDLPSGGYLIIDYAEAMTVIDINSGSFTGRGKGARLEDTISKTNLEAADEVVRQLRLRDIGGIIVIDFIDMARARNRDAVLKTLRKALDEDRTKTYVMEISPLGLVEMTRQNVTDGVREILTKPCPTCHGDGVVLSEETVAIEVERKLRDLAADKPNVEAFLIQVNPRVSSVLLSGPGQPPLLEIEEDVHKHFHFEGSEGLPIDHFAVTLEGTRAEIEERALPFREGEEVLVTIEEPHMYNEDDAVAKVDGYVISV